MHSTTGSLILVTIKVVLVTSSEYVVDVVDLAKLPAIPSGILQIVSDKTTVAVPTSTRFLEIVHGALIVDDLQTVKVVVVVDGSQENDGTIPFDTVTMVPLLVTVETVSAKDPEIPEGTVHDVVPTANSPTPSLEADVMPYSQVAITVFELQSRTGVVVKQMTVGSTTLT